MKIRALVQSDQWLDRAGVRIRYRRIAPHLHKLGASIEVDVIDNLEAGWLIDDDVIILSKCTDARALLVADFLRERGVLVGIDMFDDYFSPGISPCHSHREFLREAAPRVDFVLCSTERMREVAAEFAPQKPYHVLNDPFDTLNQAHLAGRLKDKADAALAEQRIDVLWFGNGDNPVFPVGLSDLAAYSSALEPLARSGFDVRIKVLTDLRALHSENLARLRTIGVPLTIEEWSQEGENRAMDEALISFLPVNHQNFSIAKSLNRGISALTGGTQILSAGFDLYGAIGPILYRDAKTLLADLRAGTLRLRAETLPQLKACMDSLADPGNEAARLLDFVKALSPTVAPRRQQSAAEPTKAVLHGNRTPHAVIAYAKDREIPSIGTPFCASARRFNIYFTFGPDNGPLEIRIARLSADLITPAMQRLIREDTQTDSEYPFVMDLPDDEDGRALLALRPHMLASRAGQIVQYSRVMNAIERVSQRLLPKAKIYRSEAETPLMGLWHLEKSQTRLAETPSL